MDNREIVLRIEGYHSKLPLPDKVQSDWEVWNASRPLEGHWTWTDPAGIRGWFFAAIDLHLPDAARLRERCRMLAAFRVVEIPRVVVERWGRARCAEFGMDYAELEFEDIVKSFYVNWEDGKIELEKLMRGG